MSIPPVEQRLHDALAERYELLEILGEGSHGVVWRGRQRSTGQRVAVKLLRPRDDTWAPDDAKQIGRFRREIQLCAELQHPNIVRLIDTGETADKQVYAIFELVPGKDLAAVLREEGPLDAAEATRLMTQVIDALGCAHAQGVIHRDLKPSNIMISATGVRRNATVLDFGLAGFVEADDHERLTATHEKLGTPAYAAPEQLTGFDVTPRADLYAWALVFLECLTGTRIMGGDSMAEVLFKQLGPEPTAMPEQVHAAGLAPVLAKACEKDPARREVTAASLLRALDAWAGDRAVRLESPGEDGQQERRYVTALCLRLRRSAASGVLSGEQLDERMWDELDLIEDCAARFGAHIMSVLGDSALLYFGYPRASEDDAHRGARAARALISAFHQPDEPGAPAASVGLHSGFVTIASADSASGTARWAAVGSTPSLAYTLAEAAEATHVLVSADARRLLEPRFVIGPASERAAGAELGEELDRHQAGGASMSGRERPMIGRDAELALLLDHWARARAGAGQCTLVTADAGVGKSRLVRELVRRVGAEALLLEVPCAPETRNSALRPLVVLLERLIARDDTHDPSQTLAALRELLLRYGLDAPNVLPLLAPLLAIPPSAGYQVRPLEASRQRELTLHALVELLCAIARARPVLLSVEDLHWADPSTVELLGILIESIRGAPLFALFTARSQFESAWRPSEVEPLRLGSLGSDDIRAVVEALTGGRTLPAEVLDAIIDRTDGVSLFVEELTQAYLESGALRASDDDNRLELVGDLADVQVPTSLHGLLDARLDRLGPARSTAQLAAALGREFSTELLAAVSTRPEPDVQADLGALIDAELVVRRRRLGRRAYMFRHALIRDAAYESMQASARTLVHARIAATIERAFPAWTHERPDLLALHHAAAGQRDRALDYSTQAGRAALRRSNNREALSFARQAVGWLDVFEDPQLRAEKELGLNAVLAPAYMATEGYTSQPLLELIERSQGLVELTPAHALAFPTSCLASIYYQARAQPDQGRPPAIRAREIAEVSGSSSMRIAALALMGNCTLADNDLPGTLVVLGQLAALYDPAEHSGLRLTLGMDPKAGMQGVLSLPMWLMGDQHQARATCREALDWAWELEHGFTLGAVLRYAVIRGLLEDDLEQMRSIAQEFDEADDAYGTGSLAHFGRICRAWVDRDLAALEAQVELIRRSGLLRFFTIFEWAAIRLAAEQGATDTLERLNTCIEQTKASRELFFLPQLYCTRGELSLGRGDTKQAENSFNTALRGAREVGARSLELRAAVGLGRQKLCRGEIDGVVSMLGPIVGELAGRALEQELLPARTLLGT